MPKVQPSWRVPNEANQLFYIQRSLNSNTIVYTALFDNNGNLRSKTPAQVYWMRFNTNGERKTLSGVERRFAFGFSARKRRDGEYSVKLKALPQMPMILRQTGPRKAELLVELGGRTVRAVYAYVQVEEGGLVPRVTQLIVHGQDLSNGRAVVETFRVKGGTINQ